MYTLSEPLASKFGHNKQAAHLCLAVLLHCAHKSSNSPQFTVKACPNRSKGRKECGVSVVVAWWADQTRKSHITSDKHAECTCSREWSGDKVRMHEHGSSEQCLRSGSLIHVCAVCFRYRFTTARCSFARPSWEPAAQPASAWPPLPLPTDEPCLQLHSPLPIVSYHGDNNVVGL